MFSDDLQESLGILVGVDGSQASLTAVDWAGDAAADARRPVTVCLVLPKADEVPSLPESLEALRDHGERIVATARGRLQASHPQVNAHGVIRYGHPSAELRRAGADADMIVVGTHGAGWFEHLILGSVGAQLAAHASGPVVVAQPTIQSGRSGPVTIGVDGSEPARAALQFGFEIAAAQGRDVLAIHAFAIPSFSVPVGQSASTDPMPVARDQAVITLRDALTPWRQKYPLVPVHSESLEGPAARVLVAASRTSSIVVVGSRGRGGFTGLLLGSVGQHVLALSDCTVAIAR